MNKIKFYFIVLMATVAITSCNKDDKDDIVIIPPRDYAQQYATESAQIELYLKTNSITVVQAPGETIDQDVTITPIPAGGKETPISDYAKNAGTNTYPQLLFREVKDDGIVYKLYYLVLRKGTGESPCNVDGVFTSYNGKYLTEATTGSVTVVNATQFDEVIYPQTFVELYPNLRGWKEVFPQFKTGDVAPNETGDGTVKYTNFGSGVMFIPSGLAHFNRGPSSIPVYSTLVYSFKLYKIRRSDLEFKAGPTGDVPDPDGVLSYQEDIDGDGYVWEAWELPNGAINPDDTDGDGIPDFLDFDDDGDGYATKGEVRDANGTIYPFGALVDDPLTTIDERVGIPRKYTGPLMNPNLPESKTNMRTAVPSDFTDPTRLRRHLDKNSHYMSN